MSAVKAFMKRLWLLERIPALPRILATDSKELGITKPTQFVSIFTIDEVLVLLRAASERTRLYLMLMLNCGMTQKDISDLDVSEVDLSGGRIQRKRSKTRQHANVPLVSYQLWPETLKLLKKYASSGQEGAILVNADGQPLWKDGQSAEGKYRKIDNIRSAYERVRKRVGLTNSLKALRKTSASLIANSSAYRGLEDLFLGHAPRRISEKHYVQTSTDVLDEVVDWLRTTLKIAKVQPRKRLVLDWASLT